MGKQKDCASCGNPWEWDYEDVSDFEMPVGKRIWPAVCQDCRADIERRYKDKEITRTELMMEFMTISGRISMKCAISPGDAVRMIEGLKKFTPTRRGK